MDEREVSRVVRGAAESVYGVAAVVGSGPLNALRARLGLGHSGVTVNAGPPPAITVDIKVAPGVPQDTVAANVADKVRYVVERDMGTHVTQLTVRVDGRSVTVPPGTREKPTA
jgi:uncharacterized alkaline shock family protein YloU